MRYRHEWKIEINMADLLTLRSRLRPVMLPDEHAENGRYFIRSLYFDTLSDRALREKLDGVNRREKFRIRYYNGDATFLRLEKKRKENGLCEKRTARLTAQEAQSFADGRIPSLREEPLFLEFCDKIKTEGLRPRVVVDYTREAYLYAPGNTRVTFDYGIRTGLRCTDFLNPRLVTLPAGDAPILLEVKWDAFLPDVIRDAIQLPGRMASAFSKYAQCRIYG